MKATLLVTPRRLDGDEIEVAGAAYRHLIRARRLAVGDAVRVVDGCGRARRARVEGIGRTAARLTLGGFAAANEPAAVVELFVAPPRPPRASWLVEKATELGVAAVRFCGCERSPRRWGEPTLGRLRRVAVAAVEQSHCSWLPEVTGVHPFEEMLRRLAEHPRRWLLQPGAAAVDLATPAGESAALVVGPEGGWTPAEIAGLEAAGCRPAGLGPTILRTETAALAGACGALLGVVTPSVDSPRGGR